MSKVCVLTPIEAERHRRTGNLPDCRNNAHEHISRSVAETRIKAESAHWTNNAREAIVMVMNEPLDWRRKRSGIGGPKVWQMSR